MIKKIVSVVTAVMTAAVIAANPLQKADSFDVYEDPVRQTLFLNQRNLAEFVFLDETGQGLYNYEIVMKNAAGVEVGRFVDDYGNEFSMLNSSGIRKADKWQITEKYLADLVAPLVPRYVSETYYEEIGGEPVKTLSNLHDYSPDNSITLNYLEESEDYYDHYRVFSYPQGETTAFTIPANKIGIFVDKKWENFNARGYYKMGADGAKKYFDNNEMFGSLKVWAPKKDTKELRIGVAEVTNPHHPIYPPKLQNQKTEYIKCKMNVTELFDLLFLWDMQETSLTEDGKVMYRDKIFNLRKRNKNTWGMITITSGACVTVAMPGSAGNVEFYVEKGSRQMAAEIRINYTDDNGGGWHSNCTAKNYYGKVHEFRIETPQMHDEGGVIVDNIPAGQYTLELRSIFDNKPFPQTHTINVTDSKYQQFFVESFNTEYTLKNGDTDLNNLVDASDASNILAEYAALSTGKPTIFLENQKYAADVNGDEVINAIDASLVLEHYADVSIGGKGTL
ncbi:MAG: hypothetical protein IKJ87_09170 [Ruminococcus sp.]|nr:hypothetical protein [Ruminococcus sp.]